MSDSLIPVESVNGIELFTGKGKLDDLLARIRAETATIVPDVGTASGRKEIASIAYKVARSKTVIDDAGKSLVGDWKAKAAQVDAERKKARDYLDQLKDDIRRPLTEWEEEQARIEREKIEAAERAMAEEEALRKAEIARREAELREREEAIARAEAEAKARADAEQAERERTAREDQIRADAEERAKREAVESIARAQREAEDAKRREAEAASRAAQDAENNRRRELEAAERAERDKAEAVRQAELRALREAEERERARLAEEARLKAEADHRAADREHRKQINVAALNALVASGLDRDAAKTVITLIASGVIPYVSISY